jgi:hypothetical protein
VHQIGRIDSMLEDLDFAACKPAQEQVPDQVVPDQAVPDQAVPDQAVPDQAVPR